MFCLSQLRLFIIALGFTLSVAGCGSGGLIVGDDPAEDTVEASNDTFTVEENSSVALLDVLANDAGDINTGSLSLTTTPQNGSASLNNGQIQYQPNRGFSGTDSLTYTVNDNDGASASATVTITVTQLQDTVTTVTATDDTLTVDQDSVSTTVDILANDTSTGTINVGSLVITTPPQDGTASVNNGQIQYQPNADFSGSDSLEMILILDQFQQRILLKELYQYLL